ncbi:MAG: hypothetical protein ACE5GO_02455 [Anaerolineales bacterium]
MATLLEQGIAAAKQGRHAEARALFEQVLQADDRNERAWLWMSQVAGTVIEKIAYVERALALNPGNAATKLALQELKTQLEQPAKTELAPPRASRGLLKNQPRRPFRLSDDPAPVANGRNTHGQKTIGMPAAVPPAQPKDAPAAQPPQPFSLDSIPLLPTIVFGVLSITAVGGLVMILLLSLLS